MTSLDKDGFTVCSLGDQAHSSRKSAPSYGISKVGRIQREPVFISEEHTRVARIGRESPTDDNYTIPTTLNIKGTIGFGFGGRTDFTTVCAGREDPDDIPTNDALDIMPDSQQFKYKRASKIIIGTEPRGKLKDATLLKNHAAAFYARDSPGPAAIGPEYGPTITPCRERMAPARPFGVKTKSAWMNSGGDNPPGVGPGRFERKDVSMGPQYLSKRRNQSVYKIGNAQRFPRGRGGDDQISKLEAARSCLGKQPLVQNRSEPSVGFGTGSRDNRSRTKICITKLDEGPRANMSKFTCSMPSLPSEKVIMSLGMG
jgi:hypothetical protein